MHRGCARAGPLGWQDLGCAQAAAAGVMAERFVTTCPLDGSPVQVPETSANSPSAVAVAVAVSGASPRNVSSWSGVSGWAIT